MRSRNAALAADLAELKGVKELVSALEGELAARDQVISSTEQRLAHLAKELDQEKESGGRLSSELSSKENLIAELQVKLVDAQSNATEFEAEINSSTIKINELQAQLSELKTQQSRDRILTGKRNCSASRSIIGFESPKGLRRYPKLGQLKSRNEALALADLAELKGAKERIAALEADLAAKDQTLSESEERLSQLAKRARSGKDREQGAAEF